MSSWSENMYIRVGQILIALFWAICSCIWLQEEKKCIVTSTFREINALIKHSSDRLQKHLTESCLCCNSILLHWQDNCACIELSSTMHWPYLAQTSECNHTETVIIMHVRSLVQTVRFEVEVDTKGSKKVIKKKTLQCVKIFYGSMPPHHFNMYEGDTFILSNSHSLGKYQL